MLFFLNFYEFSMNFYEFIVNLYEFNELVGILMYESPTTSFTPMNRIHTSIQIEPRLKLPGTVRPLLEP